MDGAIRLMGGANSSEGRVEICQSNNFDTMCDDFWDEQEAKVVCRQLGYADTGSYQPKNYQKTDILFCSVLLQCDYDTLIL